MRGMLCKGQRGSQRQPEAARGQGLEPIPLQPPFPQLPRLTSVPGRIQAPTKRHWRWNAKE